MRRFNEQPVKNDDGTFSAIVLDISQEGWPEVARLNDLPTMLTARGKSQQFRLKLEREAMDRGESIV